MDRKKYLVECECGCSVLAVDKWDAGRPEESICINYYTSGNKPFWCRVKDAWSILIGKDYVRWEVFVNEKDIDEFKKFVLEL